MAQLLVLSDDDTGENEHIDAEDAFQALTALAGQPTEAEIAAFVFADFRRTRITSTEPPDAVMLNDTYAAWYEFGPPGPSQLNFKVKDDTGAILTGFVILT